MTNPTILIGLADTNDAYKVTLRDLISAVALAGLCASPDATNATSTQLATDSFTLADAWLAKREER